MKKYIFIGIINLFISCKSYDKIVTSDIKSIKILYQSETWNKLEGYRLDNGTIIEYDKGHSHVRQALFEFQKNNVGCKTKNLESIDKYISRKKTINYIPAKIIPFTEFGIVETLSNKIIYYGIWDNKTLIDLTNNKVYVSSND